MSILRFVARSLMASVFVVDGAKAISDPEPFVPCAEKVAETAVPMAQRLAPECVSDRIPDDPESWVRIGGVAKILGGLGLATGIARRPSAALLGLTMIPKVMRSLSADEEESEAKESSSCLSDLALFGGVMLAALEPSRRARKCKARGKCSKRAAKATRKQKRSRMTAAVAA